MISSSPEFSASLPASPAAPGRPYEIRRLCVLVGIGVPNKSPATAQRGPDRAVPATAQPSKLLH